MTLYEAFITTVKRNNSSMWDHGVRPINVVTAALWKLVGIATPLQAVLCRVHIPPGQEIFLFFVTSHVLWRPPVLPFSGYRVSLLEVKRPVREADHSPPSSAKVKTELSHSYIPPVCVHGVDGEDVTFSFTNALWYAYYLCV